MLLRLIWHWLLLVLALYLITLVKPIDIHYDALSDLAWAALALIIINTLVKPILILISLPLVLLTLGLFLLVINAIILDNIPRFVVGFHVPSFGSAFFGSILLSLITGYFSRYERRVAARRREAENAGPVIDI